MINKIFHRLGGIEEKKNVKGLSWGGYGRRKMAEVRKKLLKQYIEISFLNFNQYYK